MKKKYFIQQYSFEEYQHGGIGYTDAERILIAEGFVPIVFPHHSNFSVVAKMNRFFYLLRMVVSIPKNSIIVFLFPVYARLNRLLIKLLLKRGVKFICFVTDINGLKDGDKNELEKEIVFFRSFKYFIVHNENMKQWLNSKLPGKHAESIEFFDFLTKPGIASTGSYSDIVFAGNLAKSGFLEKLSLLPGTLHFHLYGPGQTEAMLAQKNVSWHGVIPPYALPGRMKGAFGLVWDGEGIEGPEGSLGDYMQYITHHKPSLYILSALPLIVPSMAGCAVLIEKYQIGFTINNLYEIEEKIKNISPEDYQQMQNNMKELAQKISTGGCLRGALQRLVSKIEF